MSYILVVCPEGYVFSDPKWEVYLVTKWSIEHCGTSWNEVSARWLAEDMEKQYNTRYITRWAVRRTVSV